MDSVFRDVRYAARKLMRAPGFTAIVVATLALAIGATTAVFSIVNAVLLTSLPFSDPDRIVQVASAGRDGKPTVMSWSDFGDYRAQSRSFAFMAAYDLGTANLTGAGDQPLRLSIARVNDTFFDVLGVPPVLGRGFVRGDDAKGAPRIAILSEPLWRTQFGADRAIVGKTVQLNGNPTTIVGIASSRVNWPPKIDMWLPLIPTAGEDDPSNRGGHYLHGVGRLANGVTPEAAATELAQIARRLEQQYPESNTGFGATAKPLREAIVGDVQRPLYVLFGCVGFVLLIACANVANLLLVRASARETEIAVRTALGAGRGALVRQLVTESLLLSFAGAVAGVALAAWAVDAAVALGPKGLPRLDEISVNARVLGFSLGLAVLTGLLFSLAPALHVAGQNIGQMLRESTRGMSGKRGAQRTRGVLVMSEMALAVVLLVGAGLLIRSFINVMRVDLGYQPEHVVTLHASLPGVAYPWDAEQLQFVNRTLERVRALPGVTDVALAFGQPLQAAGIRNTFEVEGWPPSTPQRRHIADVRMVTPGFFNTLGIPLVRGRSLLPSDGPSAPAVVLVSQAFVQQYFPNDNPIGKRVWLGWNRQRSADPKDTVTAGGTIVGVVGDIKARSLTQPAPAILYAPLAQFPFPELSILARSNGAPEATIRAVRAVLSDIAPGVALYNAQPMTDVVSDSVAQARFYTMLLTAFAIVALVLAALGIYGVISYSVGQRTREIGIRIALGATRPRVVRLVVSQGLGLTIAGIVVGLFGARQLTRVLGSLLFNVPPADRFTYAAVALLLTGVAWMASYVPARRAARVDPVSAMRAE